MIELANPSWTVSMHDPPLLRAHKQLPRRKDILNGSSLRSQYHAFLPSSAASLGDEVTASQANVSTTSMLPPTPPTVQTESDDHGYDNCSTVETAILRSEVMTPAHQMSPLTPDITPDITPPRFESSLLARPFLGSQPSIVSTCAESFKTAREELSSDDGLEGSLCPQRRPPRKNRTQVGQVMVAHGASLGSTPLARGDGATPQRRARHYEEERARNKSRIMGGTFEGESVVGTDRSGLSAPEMSGTANIAMVTTIGSSVVDEDTPVKQSPLLTPPRSPDPKESILTASKPLLREQSLKERVEDSRRVGSRPSTEKFAQDIGWSHIPRSAELNGRMQSWRLSGVSTTSTVEAIVVDTFPKPQQTLRHSKKHGSLRSASSPVPNSNRNSLLSNPESPHRLVHKKGKLNSANLWGTDSEITRNFSVPSSNAASPKQRDFSVAVIPERKSSLKSSTHSNKTNSLSQSPSSDVRPPSFAGPNSQGRDFQTSSRKKRTLSESLPLGGSFADRGRDRLYAPSIPTRSSSLSAPTTRSHSRANSITSEHLRIRRQAAEDDLRQTLERMGSNRRTPTLKAQPSKVEPPHPPPRHDTEHWESLRSPSTHNTLFSQPSILSSSPGPVEMGEARAVNYFSHNNHSLQLIEQHSLAKPRRVQELITPDENQQLHLMLKSSGTQDLPQMSSQNLQFPTRLLDRDVDVRKTSGRDLQIPINKPMSPLVNMRREKVVDSPLRNPRAPPQAPKFKIIPPSPGVDTPVEETDAGFTLPKESKGVIGHGFASLNSKHGPSFRRPSLQNRRHSGSFVEFLSRSVSLRNPQNRKADQNIDGNLHPFWRPRGFWDDFRESDGDDVYSEEDIIVKDSIGIPQKRIIFDGPLSLVRKISDSSRQRRQNRKVSKQISHGNLSRLRAGRRNHTVPGLGLHFQLTGFRDVRQRMVVALQKKEDARHEKRREDLRRSIGANVVVRGDSRFPPESTGSPE